MLQLQAFCLEMSEWTKFSVLLSNLSVKQRLTLDQSAAAAASSGVE